MQWMTLRVLFAAAVTVLGAMVGFGMAGIVWPHPQAPVAGAVLGGAIGALTAAFADSVRGMRLIGWLRGGQQTAVPRDAGYWGEVGYRVERAIRLREKQAARAELRLAQFRSALEASPNGVLILDAGDHIEWCNAVAADHFGLDPVRDLRQRVTNLLRAPAFVAHLQQGHWDAEVTMPAPGGRGTLLVVVRPYDEGQKLVLSRDVTERERADAMRRDFVANVSHEIRTPLTVLTGAIETMQSLPLDDEGRQRLLTMMSQQAGRMQSLVADLLTLATLEGSPRPPADRWLALAPLMARAEADARALSAGRHRIAFAGDAALQVAGAERELVSAVTNLVHNAVRYTPSGGSIDVAWRGLDDGRAEIAVADSGIGIGREHLPRLAERFYRVDGSRSRDTGGTGLGLSIVKHVMQRHGGELAVTSELGKGSCFRLLFPGGRARRQKA